MRQCTNRHSGPGNAEAVLYLLNGTLDQKKLSHAVLFCTAGSPTPIRPSNVPRAYADLVAQQFLDTNPGYAGCKEVKAKVKEACAQVSSPGSRR